MSADLAVNGVHVLEATLALPRVGAWHADIAVDAPDASHLTGAVTLASGDGSLSLTGTAVRAEAHDALVRLRVVGGAGGLARPVPARYYRAVGAGALTFRNVLVDLLRDAGESLDASSEAAVLSLSLPSGRGTGWTRRADLAARALDALMGETDAVWRILPSGALWVGHETWPTAAAFAFTLLDSDARPGAVALDTDTFALRPGTRFADTTGVTRSVSYVEYRATDDNVTATVWYERAA